MKIAVVVESFPAVSETFILNQITDLIDRGNKVKIFALRRGDKEVLHQRITDYDLLSKTYYKNGDHKSKLTRYIFFLIDCFNYSTRINWALLFKKFNILKNGRKAINLNFYLKIRWLLKKEEFDIIHAHFGHVATQLADSKIFYKKSKIVVSFHGYDIHPARLGTYKKTYKELFKISDAIICNTKYTADLLEKLNFNRKPLIMPVGLDTKFFKRVPVQKLSKNIRLIFVGRLITLKGPQILINIFRELHYREYKDLELVIIGDGPEMRLICEEIENFGFGTKILVLGSLTQEAIKEELNKADIFIFPGIVDGTGRSETQGLVIQEAQAMELPVVVSDVGGMKYGLIDNETGYVVKSRDIGAFADKVEFLIKNEEKRLAMGQAGRAYVTENYDSRILGKKLESIYRQLLHN